MDLYPAFEDYCDTHDLFRGCARLLLAVSGGADSVVLCHLFSRMRPIRRLDLAVVHLNHGLRGKAADRDERWVGRLAARYGFRLHSRKTSVSAYASAHGLSTEEAGRILRFEFFDETRLRLGFDCVALGHHADDQAETILMNLIRGSGLRGLGGMVPRRGRVIHPLLFATREEIHAYADEQGLEYVEDASNRDAQFLRNRIRHDILNRLRNAAGRDVVAPIVRTGNTLREVEACMESLIAEAKGRVVVRKSPGEIILDIIPFLHYFTAVRKMLIVHILKEVDRTGQSIRASFIDRVHALIEKGKSGGFLEAGGALRVIRSRDTVVFTDRAKILRKRILHLGKPLEIPEIGLRFRLTCKDARFESLAFPNRDRMIEYADSDRLELPLIVRGRKNGDWFIPLGMRGKKKLHDFFIDERIPVHCRASLPILCSGDDIVWVVGYRLDDRFKVDRNTMRVLEMKAELID